MWAPPPALVKAVPHLRDDVAALQLLFQGKTPHPRRIWTATQVEVVCGFVDANGKGFGSSLCRASGEVSDEAKKFMSHRIGRCGLDCDDSTSNYRELENLVDAVEAEAEQGSLRDAELMLMTDNMVAEAAVHKGTSSSQKLFELVLQLRRLEMVHDFSPLVIHVAGTRMIEQGTDGLSRGTMLEGVMVGKSFLSCVPLHKGAVDRSPELVAWLRQAVHPRNPIVLELKD